ncbi:MAG: hypothetical protein ACI8X5_003843 [Planctomycetota bacterium]|jgi:hypothetical protein
MISSIITSLILALPHIAVQETRTPIVVENLIRGRAEFASDGAPIVGLTIKLDGRGIGPLLTQTDVHGYFEFPRISIDQGSARVTASFPPGIRFIAPMQNAPLAGLGPFFRGEKVPTASFHGIALDLESLEPIPNAWVKIQESGGPTEICPTDVYGRFSSEEEFREGSLSFCSWDNRIGQLGSGAWISAMFYPAHSSKYRRVQLAVGARIELDLFLGAGVDDSTCSVKLRRPGKTLADQSYDAKRLTLNSGVRPWVRTPADGSELTGRELIVYQQAGPRAWLAKLPEKLEGPLKLNAVACGTLTGRLSEDVLNPSPRGSGNYSKHVEAGATLQFERQAEFGLPPLAFKYKVPNNEGFRISWIEAEHWRVLVKSAFYPELESVVRNFHGSLKDCSMCGTSLSPECRRVCDSVLTPYCALSR